MIVDQRQLRPRRAVQQVFALVAVARGEHLATPAAEQAVHAHQDAVLVVHAEHLGAVELRRGFRPLRRGQRRRRLPRQRHAHAEHAALARPGAYFQPVAEHLAQPVGDRQAEAEALFRAGLVAVQALELLEDHLQLVGRNARPAVPHFQAQAVLLVAHAEQDATLGVAEGVGEEVLQHPAQQLDVALHPQRAAVQAEVDALFLRQHPEFHAERLVQAVQREGAALGADPAAFQARDVQQVGDQILGRAQRGV
ncbi:hypothetical protein D9M71_405000 [compost metagenome]